MLLAQTSKLYINVSSPLTKAQAGAVALVPPLSPAVLYCGRSSQVGIRGDSGLERVGAGPRGQGSVGAKPQP